MEPYKQQRLIIVIATIVALAILGWWLWGRGLITNSKITPEELSAVLVSTSTPTSAQTEGLKQALGQKPSTSPSGATAADLSKVLNQ